MAFLKTTIGGGTAPDAEGDGTFLI